MGKTRKNSSLDLDIHHISAAVRRTCSRSLFLEHSFLSNQSFQDTNASTGAIEEVFSILHWRSRSSW